MTDSVELGEDQKDKQAKRSILSVAEDLDNYNDKYLTFELSRHTYGVDILTIKEIIEYGQVTKIPLAPDYIRGVINLRGNVVPIVDLSVRLGKPRQEANKKTCVIILEMEQDDDSMVLGFMVDSVNEVIDIDEEEVETTPSFGMDIRTDFIAGMGKVNERFVIILDLDKVLSIKELSEFFKGVSEEQD